MTRPSMGNERTSEIDAAASDWLIRRDSGAWSAGDQARLEAWLNASALHRVAFLRLELAWEATERLKALGAGIPSDRPPPPGRLNLTPFFEPPPADPADEDTPPRASPRGIPTSDETSALPASETHPVGEVDDTDESVQLLHRSGPHLASGANPLGLRHRRQFFKAGTTLLFAVAIGAYLAFAPNGERYATAVGGFALVPMPDGSKVTLNTDSQIRIALPDTERRVELSHGEAFFEVSKAPASPFVVRAGNKRIIAVGTKFSVRRDGA